MPIITVRRHLHDLKIDCPAGETILSALEGSECLPRADCGGRGACGLCRVRAEIGTALPPTPRDLAKLPPPAIARGIRLACQARPTRDLAISLEAPRNRSAWTVIDDLPPPLRPEGDPGGVGLGIAVDLGSTNIRLSLLDLASGRRLAALRGHNPQCRYGSDILTRISHAHRDAAVGERMTTQTRRALGEGIAALFDRAAGGTAGRHEVTRLRLVGNTAVLTLLAGAGSEALLDPDNWSRHVPCRLGDPAPWRRAWRLDDGADLALCDSLSGFVGSDLTAGVIAAGLTRAPAPAMLIDFGTNTEIALWDGATLWVAAAAGGPAFEGSGISCGAPAETGAVHRVTWPAAGGAPSLGVIGGGPPLGLCGSGLIDAVAGLRHAGIVAASGRMAAGVPREGWALSEGAAGPAAGPGLRLSRQDVDALQRAKAAVAAAAVLLMRRAGVPGSALGCLMVSGIFGRHLDLGHAQAIGLLPSAPACRLLPVEDSALRGCERLLAPDGARLQAEIEGVARAINLAAEADYEDIFVDQLRLAAFV